MTDTAISRPATPLPVHERRPAGGWAERLAAGAATLMAVASAVGLLAGELYEDPPALRAMLRGHDLVTLAVAVPLVVVGLAAHRQGHLHGRTVWLGGMAFATYNYAVYVFGSAFNDLFLVHVAILLASAVSLTTGLVAGSPPVRGTGARKPARAAAGLVAFLALGLGAMWIFNAVRFALTGEPPAESELVLPAASTHLGYALDLMLIVPAYATAAVLLWRGRSCGFTIAPVLLVGGLLQQLTYMSALVFQTRADVPGATVFDPGEPIVIAAYAIALALLVRPNRRPIRDSTPSERVEVC